MSIEHFMKSFSFSQPAVDEVNHIMKDLFADTNINLFVYFQGTQDGTITGLFSNQALVLKWFQGGYPIDFAFKAEFRPLQTYRYWWSDSFPKQIVSISGERINGFSIVRRYPKYFEMFGFSDSDPLHASSYINSMKDFEHFADHFVKSGKSLIKRALDNPLIVPKELALKDHQEMCLGRSQKRYVTQGLYGDTYLISYECYSLQLLSQGKSYKEIARILSVSDKTIEKYFANVKRKTGYNPRDIIMVGDTQDTKSLTIVKNAIS